MSVAVSSSSVTTKSVYEITIIRTLEATDLFLKTIHNEVLNNPNKYSDRTQIGNGLWFSTKYINEKTESSMKRIGTLSLDFNNPLKAREAFILNIIWNCVVKSYGKSFFSEKESNCKKTAIYLNEIERLLNEEDKKNQNEINFSKSRILMHCCCAIFDTIKKKNLIKDPSWNDPIQKTENIVKNPKIDFSIKMNY